MSGEFVANAGWMSGMVPRALPSSLAQPSGHLHVREKSEEAKEGLVCLRFQNEGCDQSWRNRCSIGSGCTRFGSSSVSVALGNHNQGCGTNAQRYHQN